MGNGFAADTDDLAARVGELRAVSYEVGEVCLGLEVSGGDLGPGDIAAAVAEVVGQWRDNLGEMTDKINTIADNVSQACANYVALEQRSADRLTAQAEGSVRDEVFQALREASPVYQAQQQAITAAHNAAKLENMGP